MNYRNILIFICIPFLANSQDVLSLNEAVSIALKENYGIQIAELEQQAEAMQVYKSNAGMGPFIDWNAGISATGNNVNLKFTNGEVINKWGTAFNPSTDITLGITLFDGGRMQATYDRLGLLSQFSNAQGKIIIQSTIVSVMQAYYDINRHKQTIDFLNTVINYYQERLSITEERWQVGKGSKLDFLQSKLELNAQLAELTRSKNNLQNAKVILNGLLNREPSLNFDTEEIEGINEDYEFSALVNQAQNKNREVLLLQKSLEISLLEEAALEADRKPTVSLNGSIGYNYSTTTAGFTLSNQNLFGTGGLVARWNLFDGNHRKNQIAISKINTRIINKQQDNLETQILNDLTVAYNQYLSDKELLAFEEENKTVAEENLSISLEKFRLGGSSILELNEAQRAYDTAVNRLVNAQYDIKISELELLILSGSLVD